MNTATATAVGSTTTRLGAGSSTARPDATTSAGTADPAASATHVLADLDTARSRAGGARAGSADLSRVRIRELGPADGDVVDVVFAGLSPRSRYLRFHGPVGELSAATRRSLTALDGRTHVALAAFAQGRPIGIVRILDLGDGRGELAVEVVDRWQGCGVGTQLLRAARDRAAELGYRELVGEVLAVNAGVHAALRRVFLVTRVRRHGLELTMTMDVDGEPTPVTPVEGIAA
jgi:GNAT superfamily N-acetyltransferase